MLKHLKMTSLIALALALTSCQLSENAQKSAANSGKAADNSTELLDLSQNAFGDGRQGGSRDSRVHALDSMLASNSIEAKILHAGAYFAAYEFQLWKNTAFREDSPEKLDRLIQEAVSELLKIQKDFSHTEITNTTTFTTALQDNSFRNLVALSAAMHKLSERQIEGSARYSFKTKSMLDILMNVLAAKTSAESDPQYLAAQPAWIYEALREANDVEYLIQLRMNFMAGNALQRLMKAVTPKTETVGEGDATRTIVKGMELKGNAVDLQYSVDLLKLALQSKMALGKGGLAPKFFGDVQMGSTQWLQAVKKSATSLADSKSPLLPKLGEAQKLLEMVIGIPAES